MCEYMITFINKLKQLPEKNLKNSVLENFSVLQVRKLLENSIFFQTNGKFIYFYFVKF